MWTQWSGSNGASGPKGWVEDGYGETITDWRSGGLAVCCAVVLALGASPALATPLVEVTVETDKAVYDLGETCIITVGLHNPTDEDGFVWEPVRVHAFENAANWDRLYLLANEEPVWDDVTLFMTVFGGPISVPTGQTRQDEAFWHFPMNGQFLGEYELVVTVWLDDSTVVDFTDASAHITVVPEPVTVALVVGGAGALIARRPKRGRRRVAGNAWAEP